MKEKDYHNVNRFVYAAMCCHIVLEIRNVAPET